MTFCEYFVILVVCDHFLQKCQKICEEKHTLLNVCDLILDICEFSIMNR